MNDFQSQLPKRLCLNCGKCGGKLPETAFSDIPDGCGYYGYMFLKQEEHKQKVRRLDEDRILLKIKIMNAKGEAKRKKYQKGLEKVDEKLKELEQFGPIDF